MTNNLFLFSTLWGISLGIIPFQVLPALRFAFLSLSSLFKLGWINTSILRVPYFPPHSPSSFRILCFDIIYHGLSPSMMRKDTNETKLVMTGSQGPWILSDGNRTPLREMRRKQKVWEHIMNSCGWGQRGDTSKSEILQEIKYRVVLFLVATVRAMAITRASFARAKLSKIDSACSCCDRIEIMRIFLFEWQVLPGIIWLSGKCKNQVIFTSSISREMRLNLYTLPKGFLNSGSV